MKYYGCPPSTFQSGYNISSDPEILTNATRGAFSVQIGTGSNSDYVYEGLNAAGAITFSVNGFGDVTGRQINGVTLTSAGSGLNLLADDGAYYLYTDFASPLQNCYNGSTPPEILTAPGLGAVTFRRGTAADTDNVVAVQNNAGTTTFSVTGNGAVTATSYSNNLSAFAATTSAQLAGVISDETGTGALVFASSPTLVSPSLGTPTALVGTNITGTASGLTAGNVTTNANLTGHITSVGNAAVLGSFTSAQLLAALTDETGSGVNVFNTSPTFLTSLITSSATFTLFNTNATTVTAFGSATTLNIGASTATSTHNYSPNATLSGNTKTVNLGTAGASGSTTNINIGSSVGGALGTTTLNQKVVLSSTLNNVTVSAPATAATLTLANNSSLVTNGGFSTTLTATGTTSVTLPTSGKLATEEVSIINALIFG